MGSLATINIKFFADLKQFSSQMQNSERKIKKFGRSLKKVGKNLSVAVTAPIVALGYSSVIAWDKQTKAIAQVEQGLKTTGNAVGYTSSQLQKMASDLQNTSLFGDEEILKGVTSQLLTFTNIAGQQFERTQQAALDLATRLDGDLKSASIQLGKALNDPVANLSALSRSGIQFSESQKKTINALVKTNRLAEAQTVILNELEKQYGGSAKAAAEAGLGPLKQLSNSIGDLTEDFGKIIGEAILPFVEKIKGMVQSFKNLDDSTKVIIVKVGLLVAAIGPLLLSVGYLATNVVPGLISVFGVLRTAIVALNALILANPWTALAVAIGAVVAALIVYNSEASNSVAIANNLNDVRNKAAKSVAKEKAEIDTLLKVAKSEVLSKKDRLSAIEKLRKIAPDYLKDITLENINTDKTTASVRRYLKALDAKALGQAFASKKAELYQKLVDEEMKQAGDHLSVMEKLTTGLMVTFGSREKAITRAAKLDAENKNKSISNIQEQITAINALMEKKLEAGEIVIPVKTVVSTDVVPSSPSPVSRISRSLPEFQTADVVLSPLDSVEQKLPEQVTGINNTIDGLFVNVGGIFEGAVEGFISGFSEISAAIISGNADMGDVFSLLLNTLADVAIQIGKAAVGIGVAMLAVKLSFTNPLSAITAGAALILVGTLMKTLASKFSGGNAGAFADGGVVGGTSYFGDKLFARVNSGEMILNKKQQSNLNSMLQPVGSVVNISESGKFVLRGQDLELALIRTQTRGERRK